MGDKDKKIRCVKCKSTMNYYRVKTIDRMCRSCGHVEDLKKKEKVEDGL